MKIKFSAISLSILLAMLLAACAHAPQKIAEDQETDDQDTEQHVMDMTAVLPTMTEAEKEKAYPKMELSSQLLYTFLLADIAAQRGQPELAAQAYLELAKATRDLRVVRRAAQLAYASRQMEQTLEAFKLWHELEPQAAMPNQMMATVLVSGGKLEEARPYLVELLASDSNNAGRNFVQIYPLFVRSPDKQGVYKMLRELAQPYPRVAEMHWVLAQAAEAAAQHEEALREVRLARDLRPEWDAAVLLEAQLLQAKAPAEALATTKKFVDAYPEAHEVRLAYARALLEQKQYAESRVQFQKLLKTKPDNAELAFAIALLSIQMGELDRAEVELKQTLSVGKRDSATVHYYLGQLNEAKKNDLVALQEYQQVKEGETVFPSRMRIAYLLVKAGKVNEAREVLQQTSARNNQQRAQLILTEAQILRDAKKFELASQVLSQGLEKLPNNPELMYEAAMLAEKQGKTAISEDLLRKLIKVAPDHAHAYNALGYSMLERKVRLDEAMKLVEKAYQLDPDDAAIMDSMGWGYYLTGNLTKSLEFMRRAYATFPDPEVAAHMGEVLWQKGEREEAKNIWQDSLKKNPDSTALKAVIKKFLP
jgi:tetratricopeptide (TPR) repeat protein